MNADPKQLLQQLLAYDPIASVADPDLFFTYPDPGVFSPIQFPDPDPGQNTFFLEAITKFWETFLFSTKKEGILFLFSTKKVRVGILLNRELLFIIIFKNK